MLPVNRAWHLLQLPGNSGPSVVTITIEVSDDTVNKVVSDKVTGNSHIEVLECAYNGIDPCDVKELGMTDGNAEAWKETPKCENKVVTGRNCVTLEA